MTETAPIVAESDEPMTQRPRHRGRAVTAVILIVVGCLLLPLGFVGHWAHRTFTDTQRYVATVGPLIDDPQIQSALADTLTDSLITVDGAQAQVQEWFPRAPTGLVNTVATGVVSAVREIVEDVLASEVISDLWKDANAGLQETLIAVLDGDPPPSLSFVNGDLVLNLDEVKEQVAQRVAQRGIDLPQIDAGLLPAQVVLIEDSALPTIRAYYSLASPVLQWFFVLPLLLIILGVIIHPRRPNALLGAGIGVLLGVVVLAAALWAGEGLIEPVLDDTAFRATEVVFYQTLTAYLVRGVWYVGIAALVIIGIAWLWRRSANRAQSPE